MAIRKYSDHIVRTASWVSVKVLFRIEIELFSAFIITVVIALRLDLILYPFFATIFNYILLLQNYLVNIIILP